MAMKINMYGTLLTALQVNQHVFDLKPVELMHSGQYASNYLTHKTRNVDPHYKIYIHMLTPV